ncbi:MAG: hypothetical protein RSF90_04390 [Pygmaiobacter sp.]
MTQGTIIQHQTILSQEKTLEYFLFACPYEGKLCYSIGEIARCGGRETFGLASELTCDETRAISFFDAVVKGTVRPETLREIIYELITR